MKRVLILALAVAPLLGGCIWTRAKVNDAAVRERAAAIVPGKTRAKELPRLMGAMPSAVIPLKDGGRVYSFAYGDAKTEGFTLILVTLSKTNSHFSSVYVLTDAEGIVRSVQASPEPEDLAWETWPFGE